MGTRVAIVTGASSGIGRATAIRLAGNFSAVVLAARNRDALDGVATLVREKGSEPIVIALDLAQLQAADQVIQTALDRCGRIDALVNIAGEIPELDFFEMTDQQWRDGMEVKFHGARRLTLRAWEALKETKGSVVFTSGNAALKPSPSAPAVAATNAAINAMAKAFSERGIKDGIQVNSVVPGATMTKLRLGLMEKLAAAQGISVDQAKEEWLKEVGIARFAAPEEIAELFAFLVLPVARFLTGSSVRMDGGEVKEV